MTNAKIPALVALGAMMVGQSLACGASAPAPKAPAAEKAEAPVAASPRKVEAAAAAPPVLPEPGWLPAEAREMLAARMRRHGEEMMFLIVSVLVLSYDSAESMAQDIAAEPRIGRPLAGESGTINALLPARFFDFQDELRDRAGVLADAAHAKDHVRLVRAYGQLAETCVGCHATYMEAEPPSSELED